MTNKNLKYFYAVLAIFAVVAGSAAPIFQAKALLGVDVVIVGANPYQDILEGIQAGLGASFTQFASNYLSNFLQKIEQNYKIANFLYYSDALINGKYLQDYMNKYITDPTDQRIVLTLLPQFSCGKQTDLTSTFEQKAKSYLGFSISSLNPNDPNFYIDLSKTGDFLSSPQGWQIYYQDLANQAEAAAQTAAQNEINSPGIKAGQNTSGNIVASVNSVVQSEASSIMASLNLGTSNPESIVGKLAASLTYTFMNNFLFNGAVFKEQATCLDPVQLQPVAPIQNLGSVQVPDTVSLLTASPTTVSAPGQAVTLAWDVTSLSGADHAMLSPTFGDVPLRGYEQAPVNSSTTYSLSVFDKNGNVLKVYNVTVYVGGSGPRGSTP